MKIDINDRDIDVKDIYAILDIFDLSMDEFIKICIGKQSKKNETLNKNELSK